MKPYSNDLRQKIIDAYLNAEGSLRTLAKRFSVSLNMVWNLLQRYRETGSVEPKAHGGGREAQLSGERLQRLDRIVEQHSDATLAELCKFVYKQEGIQVSESTMSRALWRLGLTRKKKSLHATERDQRPEVRKARQEYQTQMPEMEADKLIFVDESGVNRGMSRTYGWAPMGQRAEGSKPRNPGKNVSLVGALSTEGVVTSLLLEGSIDGAAFKAFTEELLVPILQPGDIVLADNLNTHKVTGIEEAINSKGAKLQFLPSYSPEFSPIEPCWSKVKEALRKAAARTFSELEEAVKDALDEVTEKDAKGWFKHCGYCIETE